MYKNIYFRKYRGSEAEPSPLMATRKYTPEATKNI